MKTQNEWQWADLPLSMSKISKVEKELGVEFPNDYRNFIINNNGAIPSKKSFFTERGDELVLASLINLKQNDEEPSMLETIDNLQERLSAKLVPFASDPFGNFFCFNFNLKNPSICFWNHEEAHSKNDNVIENLAVSFSDFISQLR